MYVQTSPWEESESELLSADTQESLSLDLLTLSERWTPALTVLAHPDGRRIGDRAVLPELFTGRSVRLSRLEPRFAPPGQERGKPLGESHLSRRPILLAPGATAWSVTLSCREARTRVVANGEDLTGGCRTYCAPDLDQGVILLLGHRVVLALHTVEQRPGREPRFGLVGDSWALEKVRREIARISDLDVPILLRGETGTGKELVARAVHQNSLRRERPFLTVHMGAIPPALAAAELFGAVKGAYTGADRHKVGYFQRAERGTLFLDEIGEAPPEIQVLLLRALESGEVQPVGGVETQRVDVRILAATDAHLESAAADGAFREALLHRLARYEISIPPLRERRDDIGRLLYVFLREELCKTGATHRLDDPARPWPPARWVARLAQHDWPGNVRQLRNTAVRLAIAARGADSEAALVLQDCCPDAPQRLRTTPGRRQPGAAAAPRRRRYRPRSEVSEEELVTALEATDFELKTAAAELGVSRASLYLLIRECSRLRTAAEIERHELEGALAEAGGDLVGAARALRVSRQGLKRRATSLHLPTSS